MKAGLLDFLRGLPSGRIFAELPQGPNGGYSHYFSKFWAAFLDKLGLNDPCLVFHSFRHGFRDACDVNEVQPEFRRAIGGWATTDVSEKYGNCEFVPVLHRELSRVRYGDFALPA